MKKDCWTKSFQPNENKSSKHKYQGIQQSFTLRKTAIFETIQLSVSISLRDYHLQIQYVWKLIFPSLMWWNHIFAQRGVHIPVIWIRKFLNDFAKFKTHEVQDFNDIMLLQLYWSETIQLFLFWFISQICQSCFLVEVPDCHNTQ
jgi:hypothetical protein